MAKGGVSTTNYSDDKYWKIWTWGNASESVNMTQNRQLPKEGFYENGQV